MGHTNNSYLRGCLKCSIVLGLALQLGGCYAANDNGFHRLGHDEFGYYRARRDGHTSEVGDSVAHNIAAQTITPWPGHASNTEIDIDGQRTLIAVKRYQSNKSLKPQGLATQTISVSGGK